MSVLLHTSNRHTASGRQDRTDSNAPQTGGGGGGGARGGTVGAGGDLLDEEPHVYIAAMQLFPIKLNFSFIKNADVKVCP